MAKKKRHSFNDFIKKFFTPPTPYIPPTPEARLLDFADDYLKLCRKHGLIVTYDGGCPATEVSQLSGGSIHFPRSDVKVVDFEYNLYEDD